MFPSVASKAPRKRRRALLKDGRQVTEAGVKEKGLGGGVGLSGASLFGMVSSSTSSSGLTKSGVGSYNSREAGKEPPKKQLKKMTES